MYLQIYETFSFTYVQHTNFTCGVNMHITVAS